MGETDSNRSARRSTLTTWAIPLALAVGLSIGFVAGWLTHRGGIGSTETVVQEGKFSYRTNEVVHVCYARPFVERPVLEINYLQGTLTIIEERTDGFTVKGGQEELVAWGIQWRARGKVAR